MRVVVALLLAVTAGRAAAQTHSFDVVTQTAPTTASMRGLSVVDERVVWASGTAGTVVRTTNGGTSWQVHTVPQADSLDFRDIEAFDSLTAYVLSAGEDGRIYFTADGGKSWTLQFRNETKGAFFDCFAFFDRTHGIAMSDPVDGRYLLVHTTDGKTWQPLAGPAADSGEAAFAASGTCLSIAGDRLFLASGGGTRARVFTSADRGATWNATVTPLTAGPSAGIFALAFRDANNGVAIGGDYQNPQLEMVVAVTSDGGKSWAAAGKTSYTSGAAWSTSGASLIAVGTPGTRLSRDHGKTWQTIGEAEYNAVQFASEQVAYAVGPRGSIARLVRR